MYKLHNNIFIVGILIFGILAGLSFSKSFSLLTLVTLFAFITQMGLLLYFSKVDRVYNPNFIVFFTTLTYTILIGALFMLVSLYYKEDTFLFSKIDAMLYYGESIKTQQIGFWKNAERIVRTFSYDDWGSLLFNNLFLSIIPNKLFVNAIYFLGGAISTVFLFRIGEQFLPEQYALLSAISYGTSSYLIFFHCSFLKESLFVFLVISAFYYHYYAIKKQSSWPLLIVVLFVFLIFFFRPAVAAFILMSIFMYYAIENRGNAYSFFLFLIIVSVLVFSFTTIQDNFNRYTGGGDMESVVNGTNNASYSGSFNYFVSFFGAFFGPFPSFFFPPDNPNKIGFYWPGLMYRLFLIFPFWYGVYMVWRKKEVKMIPLLSFVLLEMISTGAVCASLELRKVLLHIPFTYTLSFYGIKYGFKSDITPRFKSVINYSFIIGILLLWTLIRVK